MTMYFITKKESETGKKFQKIKDKFKVCLEDQKALADKYGFISWRRASWEVVGGISSVTFHKCATVDAKLWKLVKGKTEYSPRLNTKEGKVLQAEFKQATVITKAELNACIGWNESFLKSIGLDWNNDEYFCFFIEEDWTDVPIPADCTEITTSKYKELFKRKND
jgi:hypothetical protein